jgi:hypothetical protein
MQCCIVEWLKPVVGDDSKAMCQFCRTAMSAHLSSLIGHTGGKKAHSKREINGTDSNTNRDAETEAARFTTCF